MVMPSFPRAFGDGAHVDALIPRAFDDGALYTNVPACQDTDAISSHVPLGVP
jgi:hypothetical protein